MEELGLGMDNPSDVTVSSVNTSHLSSSILKVSPSLPRNLSVFGSFEERQRTCSLHHLQIGLLSCNHSGQFDFKQPVESKSYKEFKATGKFFSSVESVSFSLSPPFSLSLILMQQTDTVFPALVNTDSTSPWSNLP